MFIIMLHYNYEISVMNNNFYKHYKKTLAMFHTFLFSI